MVTHTRPAATFESESEKTDTETAVMIVGGTEETDTVSVEMTIDLQDGNATCSMTDDDLARIENRVAAAEAAESHRKESARRVPALPARRGNPLLTSPTLRRFFSARDA